MNRRAGILPTVIVAVALTTGACGGDSADDDVAVDVVTVDPDSAVSGSPDAAGETGAVGETGDVGSSGGAEDIAAAACALVTDEEASAILGVPLGGPGSGSQQGVLGRSTCRWGGTLPEDERDVRTLQVSVSRTEWISGSVVGNRTARTYFEQNKSAPGADAVEPPADLGADAFFSNLGLCVLENDDLAWCVSSTGQLPALEDPVIVDRMRAAAALVDGRIA